jgi:hypothetical protein
MAAMAELQTIGVMPATFRFSALAVTRLGHLMGPFTASNRTLLYIPVQCPVWICGNACSRPKAEIGDKGKQTFND